MPQSNLTIMPLQLMHLTRDEHRELARLLNQVEDNLTAATRIVSRALFTDRVLYIAGTVQTRLIDPLSEAWGQLSDQAGSSPAAVGELKAGSTRRRRRVPLPDQDPYQNVGYGRGHR
jgi:hypothetical protein